MCLFFAAFQVYKAAILEMWKLVEENNGSRNVCININDLVMNRPHRSSFPILIRFIFLQIGAGEFLGAGGDENLKYIFSGLKYFMFLKFIACF